jgi:hypothetical protein
VGAQEADAILPAIGLQANSTFIGTVRVISYTEITNYAQVQSEQDIEYAVGTTFGSELWDDTPLIGSQWVDDGDGTYSYTGDGSFNALDNTAASVGGNYLIEFDVVAISGDMKIQAGTPAVGFNEVGRHSLLLTGATSTTFKFARSSGVVSCTVTNISIKEVQGNAISGFGLPDNARELFQFNAPNLENISPPPQQLPSTIETAS